MKQSNTAKYAYAAGIVDGEGCFFVGYRIRYDKNSFEQKIQVSQKDGRIVDWFYGTFGGFVRWQDKERKIYCWTITDNKAYEFAKKICPFLRYKKDQAELFIRFCERKIGKKTDRSVNGNYKSLSQDELEKRFEIIKNLKELKHNWKKSAVVETKCEESSNKKISDSPNLQK